MKVSFRSLVFGFLILVATLISVALNTNIGCRIAVLMLLVLCIFRGRREKYLINPYYLFAITPLSLLIYVNLSYNYMVDLTVHTWILAIINMAAFLIAMDFTPNYRSTYRCIGAGEGEKLIKNTAALLVMGFLPSVYRSITGTIMPLASVFSLFTSAGLVCALKSKNKKVIICVLIAFAVSYWGYVSKSSILSLALGILIGFEKYYLSTRKQKITLIALSGVGLLVMVFAFTFANQDRGTVTAAESVAYYARYGGVTWNRNNALLMPYMYLTTPWANLQHVIETQNTRTYGLWLIKPILGYLQLDNLFEKEYLLSAYSNFNTLTFIATQFKDFGYWGSIISSVFLGYFTKKVYSRHVLSRSPLDVASYVLVGQAVLQMFFSNEFFTQSFPFTIVIIMGIYKYVFCRRNEIELEENGEGEIYG